MRLRMMMFVVMVLQISKLETIQCYTCNEYTTCPGWQRPPQNSWNTDLFTYCVTAKLANGTIVGQIIYDGDDVWGHCQEFFREMIFNINQWNQEVLIDCCAGDLCNAPSASAPCHAPFLLATSWCLLSLLRL